MRKRMSVLLLALLLALCVPALAAAYEAVIDGRTSDRVHLRAGPGTGYDSQGLFFTGTPVVCYGTSGAWTQVSVGAQTGYIMSQYLTTGYVASRQPSAYAVGGQGDSWAVYQVPLDRAQYADLIDGGEYVTVLGETADQWYYVQTDEAAGYIRAQYLRLSGQGGYDWDDDDGYDDDYNYGYGAAVVYVSGKSDRVHLRAGRSADTRSLGLYFSGTAAECLSDLDDTWVHIRIGSQSGYMMSRYLSEYPPVSRQPDGTVVNIGRSGSVNLRDAPNGRVKGSLSYHEEVTVLGETVDQWYYVLTQWGDDGYVAAHYLRVED